MDADAKEEGGLGMEFDKLTSSIYICCFLLVFPTHLVIPCPPRIKFEPGPAAFPSEIPPEKGRRERTKRGRGKKETLFR